VERDLWVEGSSTRRKGISEAVIWGKRRYAQEKKEMRE
jgi:hypothetical protein